MTLASRPRRSALYLPASNAKALAKARTLPCDVVILDLEDAVAPELKDAAREAAIAAVFEGGFGERELVIRANALGTEWARRIWPRLPLPDRTQCWCPRSAAPPTFARAMPRWLPHPRTRSCG